MGESAFLPNGVMPASVTPFGEAGQIDYPGLARLLARFKTTDCSGVVLSGSNGEGPSLSAVEKRDLIKAAVPLAHGLPVILGMSTPSLEEAIWLCESSRKVGAAAALVMPPGFFREATEDGIVKWYEELLKRTTQPVLAYHFPSRTGFTFSPELVARLCSFDGIIGVKDSSGNPDNIVSFAQARNGKKLYVGDERLFLRALEAQWNGTISGKANVLSRWMTAVFEDWSIDRESAETKFALIEPVVQALRTPPQPAANKWLLTRAGLIDCAVPRLPLLPLDDAAGAALWEQMKRFIA